MRATFGKSGRPEKQEVVWEQEVAHRRCNPEADPDDGGAAALASGLKGMVASVCEVGAVSSQSERHCEVGPRGHPI